MNEPRDLAIDRLLRESFKASEVGLTDSCLDAETIAAWFDGGLSGAPLALAEAHVADCARCRAMVGAIVRTSMPSQSGNGAEVFLGIGRQAARPRWFTWLVPATAAAAALVLWTVVPRNTNPPPSAFADHAETRMADARPQESAPIGRVEPEQAPTFSKDAAPIPQKADRATSTEPVAAEARRDTTRNVEADTDRRKEESAAPLAPAAPPPVTAPVAAGSTSAPASLDALSARRAAAAFGPVIVSADGRVRWRLAGATIERSADAGSRWDRAFSGDNDLTAGSAPSADVCWVVGQGGIILRSTDGRTFSRIPFPEPTDLSAVQASNAMSASVTTADGRVFDTADGGITWIRR